MEHVLLALTFKVGARSSNPNLQSPNFNLTHVVGLCRDISGQQQASLATSASIPPSIDPGDDPNRDVWLAPKFELGQVRLNGGFPRYSPVHVVFYVNTILDIDCNFQVRLHRLGRLNGGEQTLGVHFLAGHVILERACSCAATEYLLYMLPSRHDASVLTTGKWKVFIALCDVRAVTSVRSLPFTLALCPLPFALCPLPCPLPFYTLLFTFYFFVFLLFLGILEQRRKVMLLPFGP
jgi:hypothetical protein